MASSPPSSFPTNGPVSASRSSLHGSQSMFAGASSSRPFLNMLNPMMGRGYQGYIQANQSVLEEEDEEAEHDSADLETGRARRTSQSTVVGRGKRRVSWTADASELNVLRPNIKQDDLRHADDSSDDEVPQDFLIETAAPGVRKPQSPTTPRAAAYKGRDRILGRQRPLYNTTSAKPSPPTLPSTAPVSIPPRPSELEPEEVTTTSGPLKEPKPPQMRGLDDYERALWNWVNVYNLDAFLQEAYYYYEGKGIYSIALSRGLNLLWVISPLPFAARQSS